eukprot:scaffold68574_cov83-Attheya_sp.AAC.1
MIEREFVAVGQSKNSKCLADALTRTQEENERLYHAIAWSEDKKLLYILSKCRASMSTDEKTRPQTGMGERPKRAEYLVILQLLVEPTNVDRDGHSLGRITRIVQGYCASCCAGMGLCYHKALVLYMQYHHWGEGRPTPKPATIANCGWIAGSHGARSAKVTEPASNLACEKLPRTLEDAEERNNKKNRKRNVTSGLSGVYDIYAGNKKKRDLMADPSFVCTERWAAFFASIRKSYSIDDNVDRM